MGLAETALPDLKPSQGRPGQVIIIGASTGGPQALLKIAPQFPPRFRAAIVIVQNMRPGFTHVLAGQLSRACELPICEPRDGQLLQTGRILMAPAGLALTFRRENRSAASDIIVSTEDVSENLEKYRNRINDTMTSAAQTFGSGAIGILLTGTGDDGRDGMRAIFEAGGVTIAQDEASCVVHDMPLAAINAGVVDEVLPLWNIAERIVELEMRSSNANTA